MTALVFPHEMKPQSELSGVIYLGVKDTVTTDTVHNGRSGKKINSSSITAEIDMV